jgi:hypothetical protein
MPTHVSTGTTVPDSSGNSSNTAGNQFGRRARYIGMLNSGPRIHKNDRTSRLRISNIRSDRQEANPHTGALELDSHADTACIGADCRVISYTEKVCHVTPYHSDYEPIQDVPIVKGATAYTDSETGKTYILIINEALYLGDTMMTSYLNPNQLRHHGLVVNDVPKHLSINPDDDAHSIFIPAANLRIPLHLKGIISYIPIRYPSDDE